MISRRVFTACLVSMIFATSSQAALLLKHGSTSNIIRVVVKSSLTGQGLTGLTNTSSGLIISATATINGFYKHNYVLITSGQGAGQYRLITGYTNTDQVATVTPNWITGQEPASGSTFAILPAGIANVEAWLGAPVAIPTVDGVPEVDVTHVGGEPVCD